MNASYDYYTGEAFGQKTPHAQTHRCFPFTVLVYVCEGEYHCTAGKEHIVVRQGETLVVPPYRYHDIEMTEKGVLHWAHVSLQMDGIGLIGSQAVPCRIAGSPSLRAGECLKQLNQAMTLPDEKRKILLRDRYIAELYDILLTAGVTESPAVKTHETIHALLLRNPGERYTVSQLAQLAGMSERGFAGTFKAEYRITPMKFLAECRIKLAAFLLASGRSVRDTAEATGFYDAYHFSKQFKKALGITPSAYARTHSARI